MSNIIMNEKLGNRVFVLSLGSGMAANANMLDLVVSHAGVTNSCIGLAVIFTAYAAKGIVKEVNRQALNTPTQISLSEARENLKLGNLSKITGGSATLFNGAFLAAQFANGASASALVISAVVGFATGIFSFKGGCTQVSQSQQIISGTNNKAPPALGRG